MFQLIFHEEADREYIEAFLWYELQKTGLGDISAIYHTARNPKNKYRK